jgi:hypothetical protein
MHLHIKVYIYVNAFMKRASAIKLVQDRREKKEAIPIFFFRSEIGNFNIGGPINQLIKKGLSGITYWTPGIN